MGLVHFDKARQELAIFRLKDLPENFTIKQFKGDRKG
jgi:hypothetical protein